MTPQNTAKQDTVDRSLWRRLIAWLDGFGQALDYRPEDDLKAQIRELKEQTDLLDRRLGKLEGSNQQRV